MTDPLLPSSLLAPLFSSADMRAVLDDRARVQRMLDFEAALARAEAAIGIVPSSHVNVIAEACRAELYDLAALSAASLLAGNLAAPLVAALTAEVGKTSRKAAGFVHWGSTSQDVIDTATVLELRAAIDVLLADLDRATKAFIGLAGRNRRNITVARTLLQQALPMPFGLKLAGYAAALGRSRDRLRRLRKEALVLQFGGAAGTLAALDDKGLEVSERLAALLDLTVPDGPWHSHRDRFAEVASAFAILAGTCGKIARDISLMMQSEVGEVAEPEAPGRGGSSTLPHKRNPIGSAAALSAAMIAPNLAATILNAQIQEHERSVGGWQSEWATFPALALVVSGTLRAVVDIAEGLTVDAERMKANLDASGGLVFAEAVSFALAEKLGRAEAHELIAEITRDAAKQKRAFRDVLGEHDKIRTHINATELEKLFRPNHYQGSAQNFIDRLVASSQGRTVRRSMSHLIEPKLPAAKTDHLSAITAATSAIIATAATGSSLAPGAQPVSTGFVNSKPVDAKPADVRPAETKPAGEAADAPRSLPKAVLPSFAKAPEAPALVTADPTASPKAAETIVAPPVVVEAPPAPAEPSIPAGPIAPLVSAAAEPVSSIPPLTSIEPPSAGPAQPEPAVAPAPTASAPPSEPDDAPSALLDMFAKIEASETDPAQPLQAEDERKRA